VSVSEWGGPPPLGLGEVTHCDGEGHEGGLGCAFFACCAFVAGGVTCRAASTGKEREDKNAPNQWLFHVDGTLCAVGAYSILMSCNRALAQIRFVSSSLCETGLTVGSQPLEQAAHVSNTAKRPIGRLAVSPVLAHQWRMSHLGDCKNADLG